MTETLNSLETPIIRGHKKTEIDSDEKGAAYKHSVDTALYNVSSLNGVKRAQVARKTAVVTENSNQHQYRVMSGGEAAS